MVFQGGGGGTYVSLYFFFAHAAFFQNAYRCCAYSTTTYYLQLLSIFKGVVCPLLIENLAHSQKTVILVRVSHCDKYANGIIFFQL